MTETAFVALVRQSFGYAFPGHHILWKHHADEYSGAGHPDLYGHVLGKYLGLELKVSKNYFSPKQTTLLHDIERTGGRAFGLLWMRDEQKAYLLAVPVVRTFSYRERSLWLELPLVKYPTRDGEVLALNLQPLKALL